nr:MAG TPA: acetyltransferase [Caudoviricetes sp.]
MEGEPVWCDWINGWGIINIDGESRLEFTYRDGSQNTYSELVHCGIIPLAYACKPLTEEPLCKENENFIQNKFGYCFYTLDSTPFIYNLYVHPQYRRRGHSRALLELAVSEIRKSGYEGEILIQAEPKENSIGLADLTKYYMSMGLVIYEARKAEGNHT